MSLRATTVRRLAILLAAVMVMVGTAAALYWRNEHRKSVRLAEARAVGMTAFEEGDYRSALDSLKYYVARPAGKQDAEALYAYGVSRARLEEPNGKHIVEGISVFNALLQLDPSHLPAKHDLLGLYTAAHYNKEAIDLADRVLVDFPGDADALKAKVVAHDRLREYTKALAASERLNELDPQNLDQQLVSYELMRKLKTPPEAMLERAKKQQQAHVEDPRFALLLAMALGNAGDVEQGKQWLTRAATQPAPDASFVRHMVRVFDTLKMYDQSQALLDRVVAQTSDPLVLRVLAQRLWQNGQNTQVIELLDDLDPASAASDTDLLAYRALALFEAGKKDEARRIVDALAERNGDNEAIAWATAMAARFTPAEPKEQLEKYQAALVRSPDNAIIRFLVGEAYSRMGETELAMAAWRRAADLSPSWATPHVDIARTLANGGRIKEALIEAQAAVRAAPTQIAAAVTLAGIRHKAIEESGGDAAEEARLLNLVEQIQKTAPGEPETLPLCANLLAKAGRREEAIATIKNALESARRPDQPTLLRLAAVSRTHDLGLEDELRALGEGGPETPRIILARAADLAATGRPQDGLSLIEEKATAATTQPAEWKLAVTQYKELIRHPAVRGEWVSLGDANPQNLSIQTAILKTAASARDDREFIARTIDRVKQLTGAEGQTWKLERARWLLGGEEEKDTAEAINTLTEIVRTSPTLTEARVLLAVAFERVNNISGAIKELQPAAELEPNNAAIAVEVARLMQSQNKLSDARTYLERAAATPDLSPDARRRIAAMLASQADYTRAIKVLKDAGDELDLSGKLLLADIHRRDGKPAAAAAIYQQLLEQERAGMEIIRAAADFYAATGKMDEAKTVMKRLADAGARPGQAELIQGSFAERHISPDAARSFYVAATQAAPRDSTAWRHLVAYHMRSGRYEEAFNVAGEALAAAGEDDTVLQRLRDASQALTKLSSQHPSMRPILVMLAAAAPEDRGASEFLTASLQSEGATQPADQTPAARLERLAALYPRSAALQSALVQWYVQRKEFAAAGQVATRMMEAFPSDPASARIAASVYRAAGQLDVAAAAIAKWRERSPGSALEADTMIAEIRLSQGDAAGAAKLMQPHQGTLVKDPRAHQPALFALLRAYAQSGRQREAREILEPTLADNFAARVLWLQIASRDIKDPAAAADWVRHVAPMVPADSMLEQTALGSAWYHLSTRPRSAVVEGAAEEAAKTLDPIVQRDDATADALILRAALADRVGDAKYAESLYRRGLEVEPNQPEALNNLSYLIFLRGGDLSEAKQMAARAVEMAPRTASFHDTLARIQKKLGERDQAIASFKQAIELQPDSLEALIGLATALSEAGRRDDAAALLSQVDTLLESRPPVPPHIRQELAALRATIKASL